MEDSVRIAEALLSDLSGFKGFLHFCDDLLEVLRAYEQEQFEDWSRDILSGLADPKSGIRLDTLNPVTSANKTKAQSNTINKNFILMALKSFRSLICQHWRNKAKK